MGNQHGKMSTTRRNIDILVLSDIHLGTHGCKAEELLAYLHSIRPARVLLNGDLIDIWQLRRSFWPASHMAIVNHFIHLANEGVQVEYICGNHDEYMRHFIGNHHGNIGILNEVILEQNGKKVWVFHGDAFDGSMKMKWLAKWGGRWYDRSIRLNKALNRVLVRFGRRPVQISKSIKDWVKSFVKKKHDWEGQIANAAVEGGYHMVMVGHIHKPEIREVTTPKGSVIYLNSGDWMENLSSLEYHDGRWTLFKYDPSQVPAAFEPAEVHGYKDELAFDQMIKEFGMEPARS
jgi:UDP-2,3-diacylglucosamine pyrophosphatase LpxH